MNQQPMWTPTDARRNSSQMMQFQRLIEDRFDRRFGSYLDLHQWSIDNTADFWEQVWSFCGVQASHPFEVVVHNPDQFPGAQWFPGCRLNFAQNMLRFRDDRTALVGILETGERRAITYGELFRQTQQLAAAMRHHGIVPGDRIAGFMPNIIETVVAMLATTSIGAVWTSCSPDFGINGVCDRFGQIAPRLMFTADAYYYNGKVIDCLAKAEAVRQQIDSIESIIVVPLVGVAPAGEDLNTDTTDPVSPGQVRTVFLDEFINIPASPSASQAGTSSPLTFEQLPFDHPLYIMYSSGTTGVPKCIVHGSGGTLIQHLKEHRLHVDLRREDVLFYYTTCGWMMWNWLVSGLASGCTVVLYDGSPFAKDGDLLLDAIDDEGITIFGTSAKFISALHKSGAKPVETHSLASLNTILSTGSPLSQESFDFIYRDFKQDICLSSISGGTDIISCFVLGNPLLPVYRGEIQCPGLGMAVEFRDEAGNALHQEKGELACTRAFPSTPAGFWNDPGDTKFHNAYFSTWPDVWAQGDYGEITENQGIIIHGRSDAVLNPGGVRIGTAEIYRQVEKVDAVIDSIVVGQEWDDDTRIVLFVVLRDGMSLTRAIVDELKMTIRHNTTPRHVPAKIVQVADVPRTISGKIVELAVSNVIHGRPVVNTDALANPEALACYRDLPELSTP